MKKLILTMVAVAATISAWAGGVLSRADGDWVGIGTGAYQPGLLDYYSDEYPDLMPAAVYESTTTPGVYRFVPTPPASGVVVVYDIVVHAENPDKVWCEESVVFRGFVNYPVRHKVKEASDTHGDDNYGKMDDGCISFKTKGSFYVAAMDGRKNTNNGGNFALYMPGKNPNADPVENDAWEVMGIGKYVEGLLDCEYKAGVVWDVEIEKSLDTPGCYRLKPYFEGNPSCPKLPEVADTYVYIHAEDDLQVYTSDFVLLNNRGVGYKIQHKAVMNGDPDYSYFGTMEDGIITFPANSHFAKIIGIDGVNGFDTNTSGRACIALPGANYEDFFIEADHAVCAKSSGDHFCQVSMSINVGADVAAVVLAVEAGYQTKDELDMTKYLQSGSTFPREFVGVIKNMTFPMAADQYNTNRWTLILLALDAKGKIRNSFVSTFFTPEIDEDWEDYATGKYTDLILGPAYFALDETYTVSIQKKKGTTGQLRIVDPYKNHPTVGGSSYMKKCADHQHYLYINANDPDYVYVEESPMGLDLGYGYVVASSAVGNMLNKGYELSDLKAGGVVAGQKQGDKFVFPSHSLFFFESQYKDFMLQGGHDGCLLEITEYNAGIEGVIADQCGAVEYYDMRGIRVANPIKGGLYIKKQGSSVVKTIVK